MNANVHLLVPVFAVLIGIVAIFTKQIVATVGIVAEKIDEYMKDLTTEVSGEDSDQCVGAMDAPTAAKMAQTQEVLRQQRLAAEEAEQQLRGRRGMFHPGATVMYYSTRRGWREATVVANSRKAGDHYRVIVCPTGSIVRLRRHVNRLLTPTEYKNL